MIDKTKLIERADEIAGKRAKPTPYDPAVAGITAFFAVGAIAYLALVLAGVPDRTVGMITTWMSGIAGVGAWLFFRAQDKNYSRVWASAYNQLIEDAKSEEAAEADKAARERVGEPK